MIWGRKRNLLLGTNVVELLLPQRRPFLMVDIVESFEAGDQPALEASRFISMNEEIFSGHFPGLHLWPGSLTMEGLGQTSALLITILGLRRTAEARGADPELALEPLRNLELGFHLHPGYRSQDIAEFAAQLRPLGARIAVGAAVEVKLLRPVFAGQRLDYRAVLVREVGDMVRFECEACVDEVPVATGRLTGALVIRPMPPEPPVT